MKLRICGDSIRLRLKIGEVERIAAGESIVETTHLPDSKLTYGLEVSENGGMAATFSDGKLIVTLPKADAKQWASSDEVSLASEQSLADACTLSLLVEKDFTCLEPGHHRDCVDDEDTFPHPSAG
jgi:hypothetical protein